jgi:hypothetical protein
MTGKDITQQEAHDRKLRKNSRKIERNGKALLLEKPHKWEYIKMSKRSRRMTMKKMEDKKEEKEMYKQDEEEC